MSVTLNPRLAQLRLKHLALLDLLADCGSLRQAAKVLCVTQPAVSSMLKEMESLLQVQLVGRDQQGARLTPAGEIVRDRLRLVLNVLHGVEASLVPVPARPHLKVGVLSMAMLDVVPGIVQHLRTRHPEITYEFIEGSVEELIAWIVAGHVDCAIGRLGSRFDQALHCKIEVTKIHPVPLKVACGRRHPFRNRVAITLEDLQRESWILLPRGTTTREAFEQAFAMRGLTPPHPAIESLSFFSNFHLLTHSAMLTLSTATAIDKYAGYGLVSPLRIDWPIDLSPLVFFCRKEVSDMRVLQAFRRALQDTALDKTGS